MNRKVTTAILILVMALVWMWLVSNAKQPLPVVFETMKQTKTITDQEEDVKIITLFDNYQFDSRFEGGWGFSCLVQIGEKTMLFDTGEDGNILLSNMEIAEIDPREVELVVLSHVHYDHVGGLEAFLRKNSKVTVYIPSSFPDSIRSMIRNSGTKFVDVDDSTQIDELVYTTGEMGEAIKEQALILDSNKGLVIITGCAHPGILDIIRKAKQILPEKEIELVMGGFHLRDFDDIQLSSIIDDFQKLNVKRVAPSHCSGNRTRNLFKKVYGDSFIGNGVGKLISL